MNILVSNRRQSLRPGSTVSSTRGTRTIVPSVRRCESARKPQGLSRYASEHSNDYHSKSTHHEYLSSQYIANYVSQLSSKLSSRVGYCYCCCWLVVVPTSCAEAPRGGKIRIINLFAENLRTIVHHFQDIQNVHTFAPQKSSVLLPNFVEHF